MHTGEKSVRTQSHSVSTQFIHSRCSTPSTPSQGKDCILHKHLCSQDPMFKILIKSSTIVTALPKEIPQKVSGHSLPLSILYQTSSTTTLSSLLSLSQSQCQVALIRNAGPNDTHAAILPCAAVIAMSDPFNDNR